MEFDKREFHDVRWFHKDAIPLARSDPQMGRFVCKFYATLIRSR